MKVLLLLALALVAIALASPTNLEKFDKKFKILEYAPADKKAEEEQMIKDAEAEIKAQNEAFNKGEANFQEQLTSFADIPKEDFEKMYEGMIMPNETTRATGLIMPPESERNTPENQANLEAIYRELAMTRQAASWDSRTKGWVTPVKNQGDCGSCAAFAAHAVHEVAMVKAGAKLSGLDLSEQHLVDCGYDGYLMKACNGAHPHAYSDWFAKNGGVSKHELNYPYLHGYPKRTCTAANNVANWNPGYKISKATWDYQCTEAKLMKLVASKGAVLTGVYASDSSFKKYKSGVYDKCSSSQPNHAVVAVGYGTDTTNGDYWIVKNSWGTDWGEQGYIKVKRGNSQCGIGGVCVWSDAAANGSADNNPTTATTTTEAPSPNDAMWCDLTSIFTTKINGGPYQMKFWNGHWIISFIKCKDSMCTPAYYGPTHACQYICGQNECP